MREIILNVSKVSLIAAALLGIGAMASPAIPKVTISYANVFDMVCARQLHYKIDPKCVSEVSNRLSEFQSSWNKVAKDLLQTTEEIVGKNFSEHEISLALSACDFPSMSNPLLINIRYSLKTFTPHPLERDVTMSIFFHEILHRYLEGKIPPHSSLLEKYKAENATVLDHLHLFALQKAVYLHLNENAVLQKVIAKDDSLPNGFYKRAWQIVNDLENYQDFIHELRE